MSEQSPHDDDHQGSRAANQAKSEPMPSTSGHRDPNAALEPPLLEDMNVGAGDPQAPRHPAAAGSGLPLDVEPEPRGATPADPATASHVPGVMGDTGPDESVETDVEASAAALGPSGSTRPAEPGDAQGVPVPSPDAAPGTSEQHGVVRGARTPAD